MAAKEITVVPATDLGVELERHRRRLGLSKSEVVELSGVAMPTLNRMIGDPSSSPTARPVIWTAQTVGMCDIEALRLAGIVVVPSGTRRVMTLAEVLQLREERGLRVAS